MALHRHSATRIVAALQSGTLGAQQVAAHQLDRIDRINPQINAIVAKQTAPHDCLPGRLAGLPITLKDQIHYRGMPCTFGSPQYRDFHPTRTAPLIERLTQAGVQVIGKTNLPPFAMDFQCANPLFGTTNNPWNTKYTSGGSSGGGAAAVAAGLSFLDIGTDLSGSLRIPASFCGVFSLLPTENAVPGEGMMPGDGVTLEHFARMGPLARSAEDLSLAWTHMRNPTAEAEDEFVMPDVDLRIDFAGTKVSNDIAHCLSRAADTWARAGFRISRDCPDDFDFGQARRVFGEIMGFETSELMPAWVRMLARLFGRASARRSPEFLSHVMRGYRHDRRRYSAALVEKRALSAVVDRQLSANRVWVLPVTAVSAFKHMAPTSDRNGMRDYSTPLYIDDQPTNYFDALTVFTTPIALTGHPVVTIPVGLDGNGLPVGAQLVGRKGGERHLIETARRLHGALTIPLCPLLVDE